MTEGQGRAKKDEPGTKFDAGKVPLELLPPSALVEIGEILAFGAEKYGPGNWRAGLSWSRVYGALLRHLFAWWDGRDNDLETGKSHLAHAGCCLLFLLTMTKERPEFDDRYRKDSPSGS